MGAVVAAGAVASEMAMATETVTNDTAVPMSAPPGPPDAEVPFPNMAVEEEDDIVIDALNSQLLGGDFALARGPGDIPGQSA